MGQCFSLTCSSGLKKTKNKNKKKKFFFFTFHNWENQTWYWEKRWLFSIGNGAEIRPLEMGRKGPEKKSIIEIMSYIC